MPYNTICMESLRAGGYKLGFLLGRWGRLAWVLTAVVKGFRACLLFFDLSMRSCCTFPVSMITMYGTPSC